MKIEDLKNVGALAHERTSLFTAMERLNTVGDDEKFMVEHVQLGIAVHVRASDIKQTVIAAVEKQLKKVETQLQNLGVKL